VGALLDQLLADLQYFLGRFELRLENPEGLWLLAGLPVFLLVGLRMGEGMRWWRKALVMTLRAGLVMALAVALAQPVRVERQRQPAVVLLADLSASISAAARERMRTWIQELWSERGEAPTYLVGFGRTPRLLAGPEHRRVGLPEEPAAEGSDPAAALRLAYSLFPPNHDRRVVLLSDGLETQGDLLAEAALAKAQDVRLFVVPLGDADAFDARLEQLRAPATARSGDSPEVEVEVAANGARQVRLELRVDGKPAAEERVRLAPGRNQLKVRAPLTGPGWHELEVRLRAAGDRFPQNDRAQARVFVLGRPQVLLVQAQPGDDPLEAALRGLEVDLRPVGLAELPAEPAALADLDLLVLDDLALSELGREQVGRLQTAVEEFGAGLVVTVGPRGAALADPEPAPMESLLPVEFRQVKKKEDIPAALAFVMDRSSSMARGEKFSILLRAVADTMGRLKDSAQVTVIMFDDFPEVVVPLTEARQRDEIRKVVLSQRLGGGTSMFPALEEAHKQLKKSAAKLKHVILLSDGQSISLFDHYGYIVQKMVERDITVTAVALGQDADQEELKKVAAAGQGRYYYTDSMDNVPKIFTAETENITETNTVDKPIRVSAAKRVQALAGLDFSSAPALKAYVASEAKPTAEVLLTSSDRNEPVLSRWRFGLGRVVCLSADAQGTWAADWPAWEGFAPLWRQVAMDTLRRSPPGELRLQTRVQAERGVVSVRVPADRPGWEALVPELWLTPPGEAERPLPLVRRGMGLYRAELELEQLGSYALRAERLGRRGAREAAYGSLARSYPEEYLSAAPDLARLTQAARLADGSLEPSLAEVLAPGSATREHQSPRWPPLLLLALGLYCLELLLRRL